MPIKGHAVKGYIELGVVSDVKGTTIIPTIESKLADLKRYVVVDGKIEFPQPSEKVMQIRARLGFLIEFRVVIAILEA